MVKSVWMTLVTFLMCVFTVGNSYGNTTVTVNFDDVGHLVNISSRYPGVTLRAISNPLIQGSTYPVSNTVPAPVGSVYTWSTVTPDPSAPNQAIGGSHGEQGILITFDELASYVSMVGWDAGGSPTGGDYEYFTIAAYDSAGSLMEVKDSPGQQDLSIARPGIKYVTFNYTNTLYGFYSIDNLTYTPSDPTVTVTSADIETNAIVVEVENSSESGPLSIELIGTASTVTSTFNNSADVANGTYTIELDRPNIPKDTYSQIKATWELPSGTIDSQPFTLSPRWFVYGVVRNTQYNTPQESACSGRQRNAWVFDQSCTFTPVMLDSTFMRQTKLNGSGISVNYGVLKFNNTLCSRSQYPQRANSNNAFFMASDIRGACNSVMLDSYQAVFPNPQQVGAPDDCGDHTVLVDIQDHNFQLRQVEDYCPACRGNHVDNYTTVAACSSNAVGDLGDYWTVNKDAD